MRSSRLNSSLILLVLAGFSTTITARTADDNADEYDVKARVVRVSLVTGEVSLKRNGNTEWEPVRLNFPLVEGDTVSTGQDSRLELQIDAKNFVRLGGRTVLRIVTLRDEGVALSVVEGTATVRLAKFDREHEYFEIDGPRTTFAAEKRGLYRIDVPREGRVRFTVRDGGSARIYSDTSGFALREGRSAELVYEGDKAGDWELLAAAAPDAMDNWVNDRERYLAQRLRYDVQYYDEYVWGAEDLDAYGDWSYTSDYGWIWRPHTSAVNTYTDWAPYRYGHWTWVAPYGWTWVGYEPWGWAPYHYGRWVFHNNYWAWCPRSQYYRNRSWWRPALVAFVSLDFSFGDSICWYPLSYHQRDPHSRHYRHDDGRPWPRPVTPSDPRRDDHKQWRGVTRVPRTNFGNNESGRPVDERIGRRVLDSEPQRGDWPRRGTYAGNPTGRERDRNQGPGRSVRVPEVDRPTGAAIRTPGQAMDEELRRSRIFRGRDPRPTNPTVTNSTPASDARPTGAVARPPRAGRQPDGLDEGNRNGETNLNPDAPSARPNQRDRRQEPPDTSGTGEDRRERRPPGTSPRPPTGGDAPLPVAPTQSRPEEPPTRLVRPSMPDGVEKRTRGQQRIETPSPRTEQPAPRSEPTQPRETPTQVERPEPRTEPRSESRPDPRSEPRPEPRLESRPEPRSEPRPEPRSEPRPEPRSEPRPEQRSEPRAEPRSESRPEPRSEPRSEAPRSEPTRSESPRSESPRSESPRSESRPEPDRPGKPDKPGF